MKQIKETNKLLLFEEKSGSTTKVYRKHKEKEEGPVLIYKYTNKKWIFPFENDSVKTIVFDGFDEIPAFYSSFGYGFDNNAINAFFRYKLNDPRISSIVFSKTKKSKFKDSTLTIDTESFGELITSINQEQLACNQTKTILLKNLIVSIFPEINFDHRETNSNKELVFRNLNSKLLSQLTANDVDALGAFYIEAASKFSRPDVVKRMAISLQKSSQVLTLNEIIKTYEKLIEKNPLEKEWQKFFDEYITLFDTRYSHKLNYKNIATGVTKYPDLVLVDVYGYIDFYELKRCGTPLIQYDESHKTWFWSTDVSKVIAQATDYLQKSKENAFSYSAAIKNETATSDGEGIDVNIINPKVIIVIGTKTQLNTNKKKHHFKVLRESLKDIEFLLYDELLDRLKNLYNTVKSK